MAAGYWWKPEDGFRWSADMSMLIPNSGWIIRYPVLRRRGLLDAFAKLGYDPRPDRILRFAAEYGPLLSDRPSYLSDGSWAVHERLWQWQREAVRFATLYWLWQQVQAGRTGQVATFVQWTDRPRVVRVSLVSVDGQPDPELSRDPSAAADRLWQSNVYVITHQLARVDSRSRALLSRWQYGDILGPLRYCIHQEVNGQLRGRVSPQVLPFPESRVRLVPDSLLGAIYLRFAQELAGERRSERRCANPRCPNGGTFLPHRRDQQACDANCRRMAAYYRHTKGGANGEAR